MTTRWYGMPNCSEINSNFGGHEKAIAASRGNGLLLLAEHVAQGGLS